MKTVSRLLAVTALALGVGLTTAQEALSFVDGTTGAMVQTATSGTFADEGNGYLLTLNNVAGLTPIVVNSPTGDGSFPEGTFTGTFLTNVVAGSWASALVADDGGQLVGTAKMQVFAGSSGTDLYLLQFTITSPTPEQAVMYDAANATFSYIVSDVEILGAFDIEGVALKSPRVPETFVGASLSISLDNDFLSLFDKGRLYFLNNSRNGGVLNGCAGFCG